MSARLGDAIGEDAKAVDAADTETVGNQVDGPVLVLIAALPRQIIGKRLKSTSAGWLDNHRLRRRNFAIFFAWPCFGVRRVSHAAAAATRVLCRSVLGLTGHGPIHRQ